MVSSAKVTRITFSISCIRQYANMLFIANEQIKAALVECGEVVNRKAGTSLFEQENESTGIYLILKGQVETRLSLKEKPRMAGAGSLLGVPATINGTSYSISAIVAEDSTFIHVSRAKLMELMRSNPTVSFAIIELLSTEIREMRLQLKRHY